MNLLHLDSSILGDRSVSRSISTAIVEALRKTMPEIAVVRRDLVAEPLAHLTLSYLPDQYFLAAGATDGDPSQVHRQASQDVLDEFQAADIVVIGAPMYNFTVPSQLKAWIDRIVIAGKTFRYTPEGIPIGLCGDKRVIVAVSRGAFYSQGAPQAGDEHLETYLSSIFRFIGVTRLEFVVAEGIQISLDQRRTAHAAALHRAATFRVDRA